MKLVRRLHLWTGVLFAPSILFFAFSGLLQILGLQDDGPAWVSRLALVHKDQLLSAPSRPPRPPQADAPKADAPKADAPPGDASKPAAAATAPKGPPRERAHPSQPLKAFFMLMSLGLMFSTGLGIYIAYSFKRDRLVISALLAAGTVLPIVLLFL